MASRGGLLEMFVDLGVKRVARSHPRKIIFLSVFMSPAQDGSQESLGRLQGSKLYQIELDKREAEVSARHGEKTKIGFGGQTVRNYVLHPDQFVKDTRSGMKVGNPQPVLDGDLDQFLEAYLRWTLADAKSTDDNL